MTRKQVRRRRRLVKRVHKKHRKCPELFPPADHVVASMATVLLEVPVTKYMITEDRRVVGIPHYMTDDYVRPTNNY